MKRLVPVVLLLTLMFGCGKDSDEGSEKLQFELKTQPKESEREGRIKELEERNTKLEAKIDELIQMGEELKRKQAQVDELLQMGEELALEDSGKTTSKEKE